MGQSLDSCSLRQVVVLTMLSKSPAGHMFPLRKFSDIAAPVICIPILKGMGSVSNSLQVLSVRDTNVQASTPLVDRPCANKVPLCVELTDKRDIITGYWMGLTLVVAVGVF